MNKKRTIFPIAFLFLMMFVSLVSSLEIGVSNIPSREIGLATLSDKEFAIAYVSGTDISYAVYNTNGNSIVNKTLIAGGVGANARVQAKAINSTAFLVGWYHDSATFKTLNYQIFSRTGQNISSNQTMEIIGTGATDRVDLSITPNSNYAYIGYANDVTDDADLRNFTFANLGAGTDTIVDATDNFAQPMFQYVSASIINSSVLAYWYQDDADADATLILFNTLTNTIISTSDRDGNMGNGQLRGTSMYQNLTAGVWFDESDSNIYFEILNSDGVAVYSSTSQDNNAGTDSRVSITTTKIYNSNQSVFIIGWNDRNADSIQARVISDKGTLLNNYTLASNENTTNLFFSLQGRNDYLNNGICAGTYLFSYTNTSGSIVVQQRFLNGTETDGLCYADTINPNGTLLQPVDNLYTNITTVNFTINATDNMGLSNITLYIYNGTAIVSQQTQTVSGTGGFFGIVYNFLFNDVFTWFYEVVDLAGNIFTTGNRTIIVDTVYPQLAITYPVDLANYNFVVSNITHVVNETNLANCTFSNGTFSTTITCNAPYFINASENNNVWTVTATDLVGQSYVRPVNFLVDTIYPQINFSGGTPENNTISMSGSGLVNVTINETNFYSIRYIVGNQTGIVHDFTFFTPITSVLFTNNSDGVYYYNVTIEDVVGHTATTETRVYTVDTTPPSLIVNSPIATNYSNSTILINLTSTGFETFFSNGIGLEEYSTPTYANYPQGYFNFSAIAEDEAGNQNITYVYFFVDSLPPSITYTAPTEANNSVKAVNTVRVRVNVIEASLQNITIRLYNSTRDEIVSVTNSTSPFFVEFVNLSNGIYYFNATACDVFSVCSDAQTRKVIIDQTLLGSMSLSLILNQYPYVDVNVTYPIKISLLVANTPVDDANTTMILTDLNNTNITIPLIYNSTSGYYESMIIFDEVGNYPFTINANSTSYGFTQESGTFLVRSPFYLTVKLFDQDTLEPIENDFSYITAEYVGRGVNPYLEPFIYPIADNRIIANSFHAPYINGEAELKLYEPQTDYIFRWFDGRVTFDGEYSKANITDSYGTNVYLGEQQVQGLDETYQFVLSNFDQKPYVWLFNWIMIIALILAFISAFAIFLWMPQYPMISLMIGIVFPIIIVAIRLLAWWFWQ